MPTDVTTSRHYPQPNPANFADDDASRLAQALQAIDDDVVALLAALAGKAAAIHAHSIGGITGLVDALAAKQDIGGTFRLADLTDVDLSAIAANKILRFVGTKWSPSDFVAGDIKGGTIAEARLPGWLAAAAIAALAPIADPTFTGVPKVPAPGGSPDPLQIASVAWVQSQIAAAVAAVQGIPTGTMLYVFGNAPLTGTLKVNGASLTRSDYSSLWSYAQASGNLAASEGAKQDGQFGPGNGTTTFTLPNVRGLFVRGWDDSRGVDSGRAIGTYQADAIKDHTHSFSYTAGGGSVQAAVDYGDGLVLATPGGGSSGTTGGVSGGTAENRVKNIALLACIKY